MRRAGEPLFQAEGRASPKAWGQERATHVGGTHRSHYGRSRESPEMRTEKEAGPGRALQALGFIQRVLGTHERLYVFIFMSEELG